MKHLILISLLCSNALGYGHNSAVEDRVKRSLSPSFNYEEYNRYDDNTNELMRLQDERPDMVKVIEIGRTHENRALHVVKISGDRSTEGNRTAMWIDAGMHAREWISITTAMTFIHELVSLYDHDFFIYDLLNKMDFYILPMMNPDGYEFTHTNERCWRHNRRPADNCPSGVENNSTCCYGVDLNRNFDWYFNTTGVGPVCSEFYPGPYPTSEPETRAVMDFLAEHPVKAVVSLHMCGQIIFVPYAHLNDTYSPNYDAEKALAEKAAKALYGKYGTEYQIGTGGQLTYLSSGGSVDWMKGKLHIPYAYTFELRDACNDDREEICENFYALPLTDIRPVGLETFDAIKVIALEIVKLFT